jgi:uncharacterized membrane protein
MKNSLLWEKKICNYSQTFVHLHIYHLKFVHPLGNAVLPDVYILVTYSSSSSSSTSGGGGGGGGGGSSGGSGGVVMRNISHLSHPS